MSRIIRPLLFLLLALTSAGCASLPEGSEPSEEDPWERYNRGMFEFNDAVDRAFLKPVTKGYRAITPDPVESGVTNFFENLTYPVVIINQLLQGKFLDAASDTGRFIINTVIGIGGIFDPATRMGLESNDEDFGQTLATWGVSSGPYLVLPFLGSSTLRDAPALYADWQVDLLYQFESPEVHYLTALDVVDTRAQLFEFESQLESAYDRYAFIRNAYLQRREYLVHDGDPPRDDAYYDDLYEDFDAFDDLDPAEESGQAEPSQEDTKAAHEGGG